MLLWLWSSVEPCVDGSDPYEVPKQMGILRHINSGSEMTTTTVIERIAENRKMYEERNLRKEKKEREAREIEEREKKQLLHK